MKINPTPLPGSYIITLAPRVDHRGFFMRTYDENIARNNGLVTQWVQENHSKSTQKGTIRGMHFQFPPAAETKLIRCVRGAALDVFVDIRKGSPTFGKWHKVELTEDNFVCAYIPRGFAHGFCTLTAVCDVVYKVDNFYTPEKEGGLLWNDTDLCIKWPVEEPIVSEKDKKNMTLGEFVKTHEGIVL